MNRVVRVREMGLLQSGEATQDVEVTRKLSRHQSVEFCFEHTPSPSSKETKQFVRVCPAFYVYFHGFVFCVWVPMYWYANISASVCKAEVDAHLFNEVGSLTGPANYLASLVRD